MQEEIQWIANIRRGYSDDFQRLYHKHHQRLYALCYRFTGNGADAEEQLQEVFLRILDRVDQFKGKSSFSTWAYRLAVNHLINFGKRLQRRGEVVAFDETTQADRSPDHDLAMALERAEADLPEGFRKVFVLHDREGFSHDEIAAILGCSASTSRSQLCRARLALRDALKPQLAKERV